MRKGFTLVELSIVLVIIGLLIGGILAAQSMISTAKIQAQVRQFQQYDIAVTNFKTKFNQLPGDSSVFSPAGNNDGEIYGCAGSGLCGPSGESANFWKHMYQSGAISQPFDTAVAPVTAGVSAPEAMIGVKGRTLIQGMSLNHGDGSGVGTPVPTGNYWVLCLNGSTDNLGAFCRDGRFGAALTGSQALALDTKMDDGMPGTGNVLAAADPGGIPKDAAGNYGIGCVWGDAALNPTTAKYLLHISAPAWFTGDDNTPLCNIHVKMFSIAGDTQ